ncbi:DUF5916 domain-containing protein [Roseateles sp. DB2]|uniref:carbohydrate binding family 9 domain-containing protein n=1 Tax=Roseateles sp. DB2 TaxID=3453717 RepID=UPI003EED313F
MNRLFATLVLPALLSLCGPASAVRSTEPQTAPSPGLAHRALSISKTQVPRIDGDLSDPVWRDAPIHDSFQQLQPRDRVPARWRTTVQILVDEDALIFGIRAFDPMPKDIRAPLVRRDLVGRSQDHVAVYIDAVGRRQSAQYVRVSASGVIADGIYNAQDNTENYAPDFDVQAASRITEDGYGVELRVPLAELRYPRSSALPWRVMVVRSVPRSESALWTSVPATLDDLNLLTELAPIEGLSERMERIGDQSFLRVRPELTLRSTRTQQDGSSRSERAADLGLSVKWRPRADWVVDATLNPDFSQVELDQPQLSSNVRYALYQAEKRPFFLESMDVTGQGLGNDDGAARGLAGFYSRAIANPRWGLRATWRGPSSEATAFGLRDKGGGLVLRANAYGTDEAQVLTASEAYFIRGRTQLNSLGLAGLASARDYGQGRHNVVGGASIEREAENGWQWRVLGLLSSTTAALDDGGRLVQEKAQHGHYVWLDLRHRSEAWASRLHLEEISPRFANDNGFINQSGIRRLSYELNQRDGPKPLGLFEADEFEWQLLLQETHALRDEHHGIPGGEVVDRTVAPGVWFSGPRNLDAWVHYNTRHLRTQGGGRSHAEHNFNLGFGITPGARFSSLKMEFDLGRMLDVDAERVVPGINGRIEAQFRYIRAGAWSLEWSPLLKWTQLQHPAGGRSLDEQALRSLTVLQLSAEDSLKWIAQRYRAVRAEEADGPAASLRSSTVHSLVYQRRTAQGSLLALGFTNTRSPSAGTRQTEWFLKYAQDLWR